MRTITTALLSAFVLGAAPAAFAGEGCDWGMEYKTTEVTPAPESMIELVDAEPAPAVLETAKPE